jgi:hypothetical protein
VDWDGKLDLVVVVGDFLLGNGDGTFAAPVHHWTANPVAVGDVTADPGLEFVVRNLYSNSIDTMVRITGTTYKTIASRYGPPNLRLTLPDVNGDGKRRRATRRQPHSGQRRGQNLFLQLRGGLSAGDAVGRFRSRRRDDRILTAETDPDPMSRCP